MVDGQTSGLQLLLAWGFVSVPLAWGVVKTVMAAMMLFH
jgi:hypothetical protein